jgi:iron-sulfur cluster assembly protein
MSQVVIDEALRVTPAALAHIEKMVTKRGGGIGMRLSVKTTGCSGKSYELMLIDETHTNDHVYPISEKLVICVDPQSYVYVVGTTIDYAREGINRKFIYLNPNEKASCGCGESFYA